MRACVRALGRSKGEGRGSKDIEKQTDELTKLS